MVAATPIASRQFVVRSCSIFPHIVLGGARRKDSEYFSCFLVCIGPPGSSTHSLIGLSFSSFWHIPFCLLLIYDISPLRRSITGLNIRQRSAMRRSRKSIH